MAKKNRKNSIEVVAEMSKNDKKKEVVEMDTVIVNGNEMDREVVNAMENEVVSLEDAIEQMEASVTEEDNTVEGELDMFIKVNAGIKHAIKSIDKSGRGITGKQLRAIQDMYKRLTGKEMIPVQVDYLKTISEVQAQRVMITLNVANKTLAKA